MGIIRPGEDNPDAFFSYAHADDGLLGDWIQNFHRVATDRFRDAFEIERKRRRLPEPKESTPFLFFDQDRMPEKGPLDASLKKLVENSQFLFIFVGEGYLVSDYCFQEFVWFLKQHGERTRQRLYIMALDGGSLETLTRKHDDIKAKELASFLKDQPQIIKKCFNDDGLIPRYLAKQDAENNDYTALLRAICKDLAKSALELMAVGDRPRPMPVASSSAERTDVLIGAVSRDLDEVKQGLAADLRAAGRTVRELTRGMVNRLDLRQVDGEIPELLRSAAVFVQPYSHNQVFRADLAGGHLALQRDLARMFQVESLWWRPFAPGEVGPSGDAEDREPEDRPEHVAFLKACDADAPLTGQRDVLDRVQAMLTRDETPPAVPILCVDPGIEEEDNSIFDSFAARLSDLWSTLYPDDGNLVIIKLDQKTSNLHELDSYIVKSNGVVLIFRPPRKQLESLVMQASRYLQKRKPCGVARVLPAPSIYFRGPIIFECTVENRVVEFNRQQIGDFFARMHAALHGNG